MNVWEAISWHPWACGIIGIVWGWAFARFAMALARAIVAVRRWKHPEAP